MTLFKRLAKLASRLDELGHIEEASEVDKVLKHLVAFWGTQQMPKCTCKCESCEYGRNLVGRPASKDHHRRCTTGQCEVKKVLEK
jgi:hypothetical protein